MVYDWKISVKKGVYIFVMGGIVALIDTLTNLTGNPALVVYSTLGISVLQILQNAIKHWND